MSDSKLSLVNLGDAAKPVEIMVQRICDAVGGVFRPWQIERVARAEAKADLIKATAQLEISDLQKRAVARLVVEEGKKQDNMERIIAQAAQDVAPDAKPEQLDDEWLTRFFERARAVSDEDMQRLWGRILAGETNQPGSFSKRAVEALAMMSANEAERFHVLLQFAVFFDGMLALLVDDPEHPFFRERGLHYGLLAQMDSIGLIHHNSVSGFVRRAEADNEPAIIEHGDKAIRVWPPPGKRGINVGCAIFSSTGYELARLVEGTPVPGLLEHWQSRWIKDNSPTSWMDEEAAS